MRSDSSSPVLSSTRSRPRQQHSGGLVTPDWPAVSSHPLSALSLLSSPEEHRSEGETDVAAWFKLCLLSSVKKVENVAVRVFNFHLCAQKVIKLYCLLPSMPEFWSKITLLLEMSKF